MSIPKVNNGDLLKDIREKTLNPMIDKVNMFTKALVNKGTRCSVDYRMFPYKVTEPDTIDTVIPVDLDDNEYAVRASYYKLGTGIDDAHPSLHVRYNRTTKELHCDIDSTKEGIIFVEIWRILN